MLVVQITRGMAPARSIVAAVKNANRMGCAYNLVEGLALVEAKNRAVELADESGDGLLLIEDDIMADPSIWQAAMSLSGLQAGYASARMRDGNDNVRTTEDGQRFLFTGNCFTAIPRPALDLLPRPLFESIKYKWDRHKQDYGAHGLTPNGIGSDVDFWYKVRHLAPAPLIVELGCVTHLKHPLNIERNTRNPCEIKTW